MGNEKCAPGCLGHIGDDTIQLCGDCFINHEVINFPSLNNQYFMESINISKVFSRGSTIYNFFLIGIIKQSPWAREFPPNFHQANLVEIGWFKV